MENLFEVGTVADCVEDIACGPKTRSNCLKHLDEGRIEVPKCSSKEVKPTNQKLFDEIVKILRDEKKLPEILDYELHDRSICEFSDYQFNPGYHLYYGGNEGIFLNCFVEGVCDVSKENIRISLGTFKTLLTSDIAMIQMGILAGNFTIALSRYVNEYLDDFTWKGADVKFYKESGEYAFGYSCGSMERVMVLVDEYKAKYGRVVVRDNVTRTVTIIKDYVTELRIFNSNEDTDLIVRNGQFVEVVKELDKTEYHLDEVREDEKVYLIRFSDGYECEVYEGELKNCD